MTRDARAGMVAATVIIVPVVVGLLYTASASVGLTGLDAHGLSTARLARVSADSQVWRAIAWTLSTATAGALLALTAAVTLASFVRGTSIGDRAARWLAIVPLPIPHVVAASLGLLVLGESGLLARWTAAAGWVSIARHLPAITLDPWGIGFTLTMAWKETPFLAIVAFAVLATRGAQLDEVARTLGAGRWATFRRVTLPVLVRALAPATIAAAVFIAGSFEAPIILGPSDPLPLPVLIWERYGDLDLARRGDAYVLILIAFALGIAGVAAVSWARRWDLTEERR